MTNNRRLFNCDNRRIETHQLLITRLKKMTTAQVVETSATVNNNSPIQDYIHPDDQTQTTFEMTPGFKPFTVSQSYESYLYSGIDLELAWSKVSTKVSGFTFGSIPLHLISKRIKKILTQKHQYSAKYLSRLNDKSAFRK